MIGSLFVYTGNISMKSNSGKPYVKPLGKPTFVFQKDDVLVEAFETFNNVEIYQTNNGHQQRMVMKPSDFDNFYSRLLSSGFVRQ